MTDGSPRTATMASVGGRQVGLGPADVCEEGSGGGSGFLAPHRQVSRREGLQVPQAGQSHCAVGGGFPPKVFTPPRCASFFASRNRLRNPGRDLCLLSAM